MSQNLVIEAKNIKKSYTTKKKVTEAIADFSLDVERGSIVSIMGKSGCGKSSVTKLFAGIETADSGELFILGEDCSKGLSPIMKEKIGYVFQWHNLAEWRTVEQNLYLPLEIHGYKKDATWKERAEKYLDLVGLLKYRSVYPRELSGGMKQRVGIARSMMMEPDILIFDQPFGALDAITRKILAHKICDSIRKDGKSMVMVTSNIDEAIQYSDAICVMTDRPGKVRELVKVNVTADERNRPDFWLQDKNLDLKRQMIEIISRTDA